MPGFGLSISWKHRGLFLQFLRREIRNRYIGSLSGAFWALVHPIALLAIYAFVFTAIFRVRFAELSGHSFLAFAAVVLWPWLAFQESAQRATLALQSNAHLIKKVAFPHDLLVYGSVAATYAVHMLGFIVVLVLLSFGNSSLHLLALPSLIVILLAQVLLSAALALLLSSLQVFLKDIEHVLHPVFMIWFYLTPILYPSSLVPQGMRGFFAINPYTYIAERVRAILLEGHWQLERGDALLVLGGLVFLWLAVRFFSRLSPHFEDFL